MTGAAAVAGIVVGVCHFQRAEMASRIVQTEKDEGDILERCKSFMSPPVTDVEVLQQRKDEMSTRMEMLIMETQAAFCKALEQVDGGTFKVDSWQRKEGKFQRLFPLMIQMGICTNPAQGRVTWVYQQAVGVEVMVQRSV